MNRNFFIIATVTVAVLLIITGYTTWNNLDPKYTCAKCHEIAPSHSSWQGSAHANVQCVECHGTALSDGFHSLQEKTGMFVTHLRREINYKDIRLSEEQALQTADRCIRCHQAEHAGWLASGHAVNYREIFMNADHNKMEKPYWDCFRCHGMFYDGHINDLMNLDGEPSAWTIKNKKQELRSAIPCLACHQIHSDNPVTERYVASQDTTGRSLRNPRTALYMRADKMYLRSDRLTPVVMQENGQPVNRAIDPNTLLCQQCHAPDHQRRAGSQDDRTPIGVHEGISCTACHKVHSNDTRESCMQCHSEVSKNCRIDVRKMNTTYLSKNSSHDIHRLTCVSCHEKK
jgi:hypothetical protein